MDYTKWSEKNMWKDIWKISISILFILGMTFPCFAQNYTVGTLIEEAESFDGEVITLEGEDKKKKKYRKDRAWFNMSDETGAIGVWINSDEAKKINVTGDYKHQGDTVKISGVFHRQLKEQGGEMAVEGEQLEIITPGVKIAHSIKTTRLIILGIVGVAALIIYLIKKFLI